MAKRLAEILKKWFEEQLNILNEKFAKGEIKEETFEYLANQLLDKINEINETLKKDGKL